MTWQTYPLPHKLNNHKNQAIQRGRGKNTKLRDYSRFRRRLPTMICCTT